MFTGAYSQLAPLKDTADLLAARSDWPQLYDVAVLRNCNVPCAAIVYDEDMYVERSYSLELAALLRNIKVWVTNEYVHSGLRDDGYRILDRYQINAYHRVCRR